MYLWLKTLLKLAGVLLTLAALVAVGWSVVDLIRSDEISTIGCRGVLLVLVLGGVYGVANLLICEAFHRLSRSVGLPFTRAVSWRVFSVSQIGKYLPGNVFHLAGRQALGGVVGGGQMKLVKVTVLELSGMAVCGTLFGAFVIDRIIHVFDLPLWIEAAGAGVSAVIILIVIRRLFGVDAGLAWSLYIVFLAVTGLIFLGLIINLNPTIIGGVSPVTIVAAYVISWLLGFVTPGAPAGLGVREYVLLLLLGGMDSAMIVSAVLLSRLVTILGDILLLGLGAVFLRNLRAEAE
jgi:hypothetical protein